MLSPSVNDDWSQLRRAYTGARLAFNLIFLVLFFMPIAIKVVVWKEIGSLEHSIASFQHSLHVIAERLLSGNLALFQALGRELMTWSDMGPCLAHACATRSILALLLGFDKSWCDMTPLALVSALAGPLLILYNSARAGLTLFVAPLRDEEIRSGHAPRRALKETRSRFPRPRAPQSIPIWKRIKLCYGWMVPVHRLVTWLEYVAYGSTAITIIDVATTMVSVPR